MAVQIDVINENRTFMLEVIAEREGIEVAEEMNGIYTTDEIANHFTTYYKKYSEGTPAENIIGEALDELGEREFTNMLKRNGFTDNFELLAVEGYLTKVSAYWILSIEKPFKGGVEDGKSYVSV